MMRILERKNQEKGSVLDLGILDFNRFDHGDPYEEFTRLFMFSARISPEFSKGQSEGYFEGKVPEDFPPSLPSMSRWMRSQEFPGHWILEKMS